jgi:hypothetical protein
MHEAFAISPSRTAPPRGDLTYRSSSPVASNRLSLSYLILQVGKFALDVRRTLPLPASVSTA